MTDELELAKAKAEEATMPRLLALLLGMTAGESPP
jgi:hypothetical protein